MDTNNKLKSISKPPEKDWRKVIADRAINKKWLQYSSEIARRISSAMDRIPGMTQKKLADKIGVKPQNISKILRGDVNLTLKTISILSTTLETELIDFPFYSDDEHMSYFIIEKPDNSLNVDSQQKIFRSHVFNSAGSNYVTEGSPLK